MVTGGDGTVDAVTDGGATLLGTPLTMPLVTKAAVTVQEVMSARLSYAPAHTSGLLAADLANYDGKYCCGHWE